MSLTVGAGEHVALIGHNGAGKTTLLKCLAMLLLPDYDRLEITTTVNGPIYLPDKRHLHRWARQALYCFQRADDQLYLQTVQAELEATGHRLGRPDAEDRAKGIALRLGLEPLLKRSPFDLPRSYRRLIPIAAALAAAPPLLLLDEPNAGLDEEQIAALVSVLTEYKSPERSIIMISHDSTFTSAVADRLIRMPIDCGIPL